MAVRFGLDYELYIPFTKYGYYPKYDHQSTCLNFQTKTKVTATNGLLGNATPLRLIIVDYIPKIIRKLWLITMGKRNRCIWEDKLKL